MLLDDEPISLKWRKRYKRKLPEANGILRQRTQKYEKMFEEVYAIDFRSVDELIRRLKCSNS